MGGWGEEEDDKAAGRVGWAGDWQSVEGVTPPPPVMYNAIIEFSYKTYFWINIGLHHNESALFLMITKNKECIRVWVIPLVGRGGVEKRVP